MPCGTRPDATPPTTAPRKYGVTSDDTANAAPRKRRIGSVVMLLRKANAAPRAIIPKAARVSGTYSVDATGVNPAGNPVHSTTSTKISQTWLASQTGPIACSITARWGAPRRVPPARRSQMPAPKSAPPNSA